MSKASLMRCLIWWLLTGRENKSLRTLLRSMRFSTSGDRNSVPYLSTVNMTIQPRNRRTVPRERDNKKTRCKTNSIKMISIIFRTKCRINSCTYWCCELPTFWWLGQTHGLVSGVGVWALFPPCIEGWGTFLCTVLGEVFIVLWYKVGWGAVIY